MRNVSTGDVQSKCFRINKFESLAFQKLVNHSRLSLWGWVSSSILNKTLTKNSKIRFDAYSFCGNFWKQGQSHFIANNYYQHFEKFDAKFHNDQRKTVGVMIIHFRRDFGWYILYMLSLYHVSKLILKVRLVDTLIIF